MRRAAKIDANQPAIVKKLRQCGMSVAITSKLGEGFPDFVCGWRGKNGIFELKDPAKVPSARKLTSDEEAFHLHWKGQVAVVETFEEVMGIMDLLTRLR